VLTFNFKTYRRRSGPCLWRREFADRTYIYRDYILRTATNTLHQIFHPDHSQGPTNNRPCPEMRGSLWDRMSKTELHMRNNKKNILKLSQVNYIKIANK